MCFGLVVMGFIQLSCSIAIASLDWFLPAGFQFVDALTTTNLAGRTFAPNLLMLGSVQGLHLSLLQLL